MENNDEKMTVGESSHVVNGEWETLKTSRVDVEKIEEIEVTFKFFSFHRIQAIGSLFVLVAISLLPLFLLGGSLENTVQDIGGADIKTWLALVHSLGLAAVAPFAGAVSDLIGRRYPAVFGTVLIIVGMAVVGTAHQMNVAIGGMAIAGVGAGFCQVIGLSGIAELVPVNQRGRYIGTVFMLFSPMAAATAYAQMYSVTATWRWGAWIPLIFSGVGLVMLLIQYHPPPRTNYIDLTGSQVVARIDYIGGLLSISGLALLMAGLQSGGYNMAWKSISVIVQIALGGGLLAAFIIWETFTPHPMIPGYIFSDLRVIIPIFLILAFGGVDFYSFAAFWVLEMQQFFGPDPYHVASIIVAFGFAFLIGIFAVGWGIDLTHGHIRELFLIVACLMTAGVGGMVVVTEFTPSLAIGLSFIGMLGVGALYIAPIIALMIISGDEVIGTVVGLGLAVRFLGGQAGYTLLFNILMDKLGDVIPTLVGGAVAEAGLPLAEIPAFIGALLAQNTTAIHAIPGITPTIVGAAIAAADESYVQGFKLVYLVSIGFGGAAIISCLFLGNIRKYMTERVSVDIH